jgi:periplasmic divalent cation tolerance protein
VRHVSVVTTVGTLADARSLARAVVERRLAACAHIAPVESFYHWQGAVQNDTEFKITFKARAEHYARLEAAIRSQHPYQLPDIHALALEQISAPYARWLEESTEQQSAPGDAQSQRD